MLYKMVLKSSITIEFDDSATVKEIKEARQSAQYALQSILPEHRKSMHITHEVGLEPEYDDIPY